MTRPIVQTVINGTASDVRVPTVRLALGAMAALGAAAAEAGCPAVGRGAMPPFPTIQNQKPHTGKPMEGIVFVYSVVPILK